MPRITELNLIAKELNRSVTFAIKLTYYYTETMEMHIDDEKKSTKIKL